MRKLVAVGLALAASTMAAAQSASPTFEQRIAASRSAIALSKDVLTGPGADLLASEMRASDFFLLGEQHGTASIAAIAAALHRTAASAGYEYVALEVGPNSASEAERMIRSGPGRLAAYIAEPGHAMSIAFLLWREEAGLAEQMVALSPHRSGALWGLDQEFVGAFAVLLPQLEALSRTEVQRDAVAAIRAKQTADPMALASLTAEELAPLERAFPVASDPDAAALIADILLSNRIYAPFLGRGGSGFAGNTTRETYLKANFQRRFEAAEKEAGHPPRVFLKFGANHMMRGFSATDVPALGNFIAEWGLSRGLKTTNIAIGCISGQMNALQSGNVPCEPLAPPGSPLHTGLGPEPLTLIDLRPLRARLGDDVDFETRRLILAFDFYLVVRDAKPSTPIAASSPP